MNAQEVGERERILRDAVTSRGQVYRIEMSCGGWV